MTSDAVASHPETADVQSCVSRRGVSAPASTQREAGFSRPLTVSAITAGAPLTEDVIASLVALIADLLGSSRLSSGLMQPSSA